jgi:hypothetical protein
MSARNYARRPDTDTCPSCGDPLPCDGVCDCTGDTERDYRTQEFGQRHAVCVRLGPKTGMGDEESVVEMWV